MFRLLRLEFRNIRTFDSAFMIDLTASDRVIKGENVSLVSKPVYTENVIALVGINASGKTTALRLINMALAIIADNKSLDQVAAASSLLGDGSEMTADFFLDGSYYRLESSFRKNKQGNIEFDKERLFGKKKHTVTAKKQLFEYSEADLLFDRGHLDNLLMMMLKADDSIVTAVTRNAECFHTDTLQLTNMNFMLGNGTVNPLYLALLDKSIERINIDNVIVDVKFRNSEEVFRTDLMNAGSVISSGTIRGNQLLNMISQVLKSGGYLLIDEIENHLNKKLVQLIINIFQDNEINKNGAVLVFSTHYSELLDSIERKDNIYVFLKDSEGRCGMVRYSDKVQRNDIKKSDIILSNFINGTAPSYEDLRAIKDLLIKSLD